MPACCQPCWKTVGDWVGEVGGRLELPLLNLCQFLFLAEGKRAGQLLAMPSWGQTVWPVPAVRPCWTLCPHPLAQHRYYINYPSTGNDHEKHTGGTVPGKKEDKSLLNRITLQFSSNEIELFKDDSAASTSKRMKRLVIKPFGVDADMMVYICDLQKDPEEEGRFREHTAHQQSPQVQKGQRNLPASRIPNTMRTTWAGKTVASPQCYKPLQSTICSLNGITNTGLHWLYFI